MLKIQSGDREPFSSEDRSIVLAGAHLVALRPFRLLPKSSDKLIKTRRAQLADLARFIRCYIARVNSFKLADLFDRNAKR